MTKQDKTKEPFFKLTDKAVVKIKEYAAKMPEAKDKEFRVYVQGGGCSGFSYGFIFDDAREDDQIFEFGGVKCLVDPQSAMFLEGATVDFIESLQGSGFSVDNPKATGTCGCGHSFSA